MTTLRVPVTTDDHIQGNEDAPITLVEYGDYECPFCAQANPVVKRLQKHFGKNLRFVFRNFPLREVHPNAEAAAETAEFAATHGLFWQMHDLIYANQATLDMQQLAELTKTLKLPLQELELTLSNKTFENKVYRDFMGGVRSGVNGTPTFFINNERYNGPVDFDGIAQAISSLVKPA
jgi:protein-disulfide isomerase